jgi:hypothetical protein
MGKVKDLYQDEIERQAAEEPFPRGLGDPDAYGYPGQPDEPVNTEGAANGDELPF